MSSNVPALQITEDDVQRMLACQVHVGSRNIVPAMEGYVYARRNDGVHLLHLARTWEKIQLAARVIAAVENPADVVVVSARTYGQRAALKFAQYTGATALAGRYTPGTFTNQIQKRFVEPRLLIVTDPRTDHQVCFFFYYFSVMFVFVDHWALAMDGVGRGRERCKGTCCG
jgi:small subunit ribosomal protein SAe